MATVVNSQPERSGNGMGFLLGVILLILAVIAFFVYGLPMITGAATGGGTQVTLPSEVNVNTQ